MYEYKLFLSKICQLEGVTVEELMTLTGHSRSVVYEWLNLSDKESFPPFASLERILCRLGITLDQLFACHHPLYGDGSAARRYGNYTRGIWDGQYLDKVLLDDPTADAILSTYLNDRRRFARLLEEAMEGEVDLQELDCLAAALRPVLDTEIGRDFPECLTLDSTALDAYRLGMQILKENGEGVRESAAHRVVYPDASGVILLAACRDIRYLEGYLHLASEGEKEILLTSYLALRAAEDDFDKKNKLIKRIIARGCAFEGEDAANRYRLLLALIL